MLPRQPLKEIGLASGLNTKGDDRAQPEQLLDIAVNVEFDDIGGLRCRYPFDAVRTSLVGGGTLANARKMVEHNGELLVWTSDSLYTWSAPDSAWALRGTHLAVEVDERERFPSPSDTPQVDRAQLSGRVLYAWTDGTHVQCAATDATTGAVIVPPTGILTGLAALAPRVIALTTKFLLLFHGALGKVYAMLIDPASIATDLAGLAVGSITTTTAYDVAVIPGADAAIIVCSNSTAYTVAKVTSGGVLTTSAKARNSDGPIAVSVSPTAATAQVVRSDAGAIKGDLITVSTLADSITGQAIGTAAAPGVNHIAACHRSVQDGGHYRCYVFYTCNQSVATGWEMRRNWVDDSGAIGGDATFVKDLGIATRAFDVGGRIFLWGVFAGGYGTALAGLQNQLLLYRDDAFLCAKALDGASAGFVPDGISDPSFFTVLPGVQSLGANQYACAATERRVVPVTGGGVYEARAPRDLIVTFDSNRARRSARLGNTLYVAAGEVLAYDGVGLVEAGWHVYPWVIALATFGAAGLADGIYAYKTTIRWDNGNGERDRSTTVLAPTVTVAGGPKSVHVSLVPIFTTHKTGAAVEVWRTKVAPVADSPFLLDTSLDPTAVGNNGYIVNTTTVDTLPVFADAFTDLTLATKPEDPEDGGVLASLSPPAAKIIYASDTRLFLAGIPGLPNQVWYSQLHTVGRVATFNDALTIDVPTAGGAITAIGALDGALIVWCETATYQFAGVGFDNTGAGTNFALARILSSDLGCVGPEGCAFADAGFFVKTNKGWFVLDRALNYSYIGEGVAAYDAETVLSTLVLTARHQVRVLTSARMLVFDTLVKQWAETSVADGLDLTLWNGAPAYLTATGVRAELATWAGYAGIDYSLTAIDVETGWAKFGAMQARAIVDFVQLLGELRSTCVIRRRLAKDYEASSPGVWNYTTDVTWTPSPGVLGSALQVRQAPRWKRCESIKARFTVTAPDGVSPLGGPCVRLTSIAVQFALEPNAYSALGAAQK